MKLSGFLSELRLSWKENDFLGKERATTMTVGQRRRETEEKERSLPAGSKERQERQLQEGPGGHQGEGTLFF